MDVPGGLTTKLPELDLGPNPLLVELRERAKAFDLMPLWFWDKTGLDPWKARRF